MVTVFKDIHDTITPFYRDTSFVFDRIRSGKHRGLIEQIRAEDDKSKRNELKKQLPAICFSGKFRERSDDAIEEHSGLICLDFDDYPSKKKLRQHRASIEADEYTHAVFTSPSGNGIKVIVRIPPSVEHHRNYFAALERHFASEHFDRTSKNVSRVCYESYDPKLYLNEGSALFEELVEDEPITHTRSSGNAAIAIREENRVVDILMRWWNKSFGIVEGERNNNVFILAKAFNEYGIGRSLADYIIGQFASSDFPASEIRKTIDSAYRDVGAFNTKFFEDTDTMTKVRRRVMHGDATDDIVRDLGHIENIGEVVREINSNPGVSRFWTASKRGVKVVPILLKQFLEYNGFYKFAPHGSDMYVFVRVTNNLINKTSEKALKDFVLDYLITLEDLSVYNYFAQQTYLFKAEFLSLLDTVEVHFIRDRKDYSFIYYRNCALRVRADGVDMIDYVDLNGYVWKDQVVDRDFEPVDDFECAYRQFVSRLAGDDPGRVRSIESTIGYLMSGYKDPRYSPAVILNDEVITENPEGGTGKGLLIQGIGQIKKVVSIDGKRFKFDDRFNIQTAGTDTQVICFDDVKMHFNFEYLFSAITEGITVEKKNRDAIKIPFNESPKIAITTNYAIRGKGSSHDRRRWELELRRHYHAGHTPADEFGHRFFDDWSEQDWLRFDNYMIHNLMLYIREGFVKSEFTNLAIRRLGSETCHEFIEWMGLIEGSRRTDVIKFNRRIYKDDVYREFIKDNPDYAPKAKMTVSRSRFYKWLHAYASFRGDVSIEEGRSSEGRWIMLKDNEYKEEDDSQQAIQF